MVYLRPFSIGAATALSVVEGALPTIPKRDFMFYRRRNRDPFSIPQGLLWCLHELRPLGLFNRVMPVEGFFKREVESLKHRTPANFDQPLYLFS